jgi:Tat protein translocase TatC
MSADQRRELPGPTDGARMTLGEHLDELRGAVVRSLAALLIACIACIWPAKYLLELIARPVVLALRYNGQPDSFLATSPVEAILVYIKVVLIFGVLIAGPYIIYQLWKFVAAGLYPHEKKWVTSIIPLSVSLFLGGVVFMYLFVLIVSLNFLVGFSSWLPLPNPQPSRLESALMHLPQFESVETDEPVVIPLLAEDPNDPPTGSVWFNLSLRKLKVQGVGDESYSVQFMRDDRRGLVTPHFRIGEYLSFVLILTIAFGLAFQTPLVVIFLARTGIVSTAALRKHRKFVILGVVIVAGILAPPDLLSHLLLSGPMIVLFEIGLLLARRAEKKQSPK